MVQMRVETIRRPLARPFAITGYTFTHLDAVWVHLDDDGAAGRGEGVGMYYLGETPSTMTAQLEGVRPLVESGATRDDIHRALGPGGARNALDCALWDLECKQTGSDIFDLVGLPRSPLTTVATVGMGSAEEMVAQALRFRDYPHLKIKLDANEPIVRLLAIRDARPDATLVIDVNQGWSRAELEEHLPQLQELDVAMVEQPLPRGDDHLLSGLDSPIPLGADESLIHLGEYDAVAGFYDVINIKLDKCGGLTEALQIAQRASADGKDLMVGNMTGTSLSMAPSHVIGQMCRFVDIDGPLLLERDITPGLTFRPGGFVDPPTADVWG
jgi:L-alanine-DL-glutamate epimerase-like enolase superfamily enzyme